VWYIANKLIYVLLDAYSSVHIQYTKQGRGPKHETNEPT
jgi:hypothetical protein